MGAVSLTSDPDARGYVVHFRSDVSVLVFIKTSGRNTHKRKLEVSVHTHDTHTALPFSS